MLKFIAIFANLQGPANKVEGLVTKKMTGVAKRSMGTLIDDAADALHRGEQSIQQLPKNATEAWFSCSFTIGETKQDAQEWRKVMSTVVAERNALIHQMLVPFDPASIESCESLSLALDDQRSRILSAYTHLESVIRAVREAHKDMGKDIDRLVASQLAERSFEGD